VVTTTEAANPVTFDAAIAHLQAHTPALGYLPSGLTEGIATLIYGPGRLGKWSKIAKCCNDHGLAIGLYVELFPEDKFLVGCGIPDPSGWSVAVIGPEPVDTPQKPRFVTCHHMLCLAVMLAILERKRRG
jgi:hypothetical protein